jgi:hypothetical protein
MKNFLAGGILGVLLLIGCSTLVIDRSMSADEAGDYTLAVSACEATPGQGMDVCRVRENTKIESSWKLVVPARDKSVLGGEADVYYRDVHRQYAVPPDAHVVEILWKDFFNQEVWTRDLDGEALALISIRWKTPEGVEEVVKYRGIAKIVVTKEGYDRLPIDSGFGAWGASCKVEYSTAGRGALKCK